MNATYTLKRLLIILQCWYSYEIVIQIRQFTQSKCLNFYVSKALLNVYT